MLKFFVWAVMLVGFNYAAVACSSCGCGLNSAGNGSLGMMSQYNNNFVGIAWEHKIIEARSSLKGKFHSSYQFNSVELMAKYFPMKKRVFVSTIIPYHFYANDDDGTLSHGNGLGDIMFSVGYLLLKPKEGVCKIWNQFLSVSGGVKLPTGKFTMDKEGLVGNQYLQPGTGSWDLLFNAAYSFRYKKWGIFSEANYRVNTTNGDGYRFGNSFSSALNAFYRVKAGKFSLLPAAGVFFEKVGKEQINDVQQYKSGGDALYATLGGNVYYRKVGVGFNWMQPLYQRMAAGFAKSSSRWLLNFSIIF